MKLPKDAFSRWGKSRWFAWWYFSIAIGFFLLAVYFWLRGGSLLPGVLRIIIAIAFTVLGWLQLQMTKKK